MTSNAIVQCSLYLVVLVAVAMPLGAYMARVYEGDAGIADRLLGPIERLLYTLAGIRADEEMSWQRYGAALLIFNLFGALAIYAPVVGEAAHSGVGMVLSRPVPLLPSPLAILA